MGRSARTVILLAVIITLAACTPTVDTATLESSIAVDAAARGSEVTVDCPDGQPVEVGHQFTCIASATTGETYAVRVLVEREDGDVTWVYE